MGGVSEPTVADGARFGALLVGDIVNFRSLFADEQVQTKGRVRDLVRRALRGRGPTRPAFNMLREGFAVVEFDHPDDLLQLALELQRAALVEPFALRISLGAGLIGARETELLSRMRALASMGEAGHVLVDSSLCDVLGSQSAAGLLFAGRARIGSSLLEVYLAHGSGVGSPDPPRRLLGTDPGVMREDAAPSLLLLDGEACGSRVDLDQPAILGRDGAVCRVRLQDSSVSRRHCRVERRGEQVYVTDLGSSNGTYVDGRRVEPGTPERLPVGALLVVGSQHVCLLPGSQQNQGRMLQDALRSGLTRDPRTGLLRYTVFLERLQVELERSRAADRSLLVAVIGSRVAGDLGGGYAGSLRLGPFWREALASVVEALAPWDALGATVSLQLVYGLFPERVDVVETRAELERLVADVNRRQIEIGGRLRAPRLRVAVVDASVHAPETADVVLHRVRSALTRQT